VNEAGVFEQFSLEGRVAVVTGGGRGLGIALAVGLARAGAAVVVAGRDESNCETTRRAIEREGGRSLAVAADITLAADRARLIDATLDTFGRLDVLVNNAGLLRPHHTRKVTEAELDEVLAVNLKGPVFLSQLAFDALAADGGGSIVNLSALSAFQPMPGLGAYSAAKAAMVAWTSAMAKEWTPRGVRVNCLVPGPIATDMILPRDRDAREQFVTDMAAQTLVGRIAEPAELVGAVVFLASDASAFMTGRQLFCDGGMLA
jgi:NAD(P)-dependent dehydrogenase (short-subunit alcohol dehydrogenase family)